MQRHCPKFWTDEARSIVYLFVWGLGALGAFAWACTHMDFISRIVANCIS